MLVDTGGLESETAGKLEENVQAQSHLAVAEADVIMFLLRRQGRTQSVGRRSGGAVAPNRQAGFLRGQQARLAPARKTIFTSFTPSVWIKLYSISAEHGLGIPDLMDDVVQHLAPNIDSEEDEHE